MGGGGKGGDAVPKPNFRLFLTSKIIFIEDHIFSWPKFYFPMPFRPLTVLITKTVLPNAPIF